MRRRLAMAVGTSLLLVAALLPSGAVASTPERFGRVDTGGKKVDVARLLGMLKGAQPANQMIRVAVELDGQPVASYIGAALDSGTTFTDSQKVAVRRLLGQRQAGVAARLRSMGATIEASFTDVFNGFRIRVAASKVRRIANVVGVRHLYTVPTDYIDNLNTVSYLGADRTWGQTGLTGAGVKIAVIDTGINYDHLDFNGAGFVAYLHNDGTKIEPGTFPTSKVIGGFDLVGDAYDPDNGVGPTPDPDPLDCKTISSPNVQHGTHVSGTAAGVGVTSNGQVFKGPYNASTLSSTSFRIGPGVAPRAKLMVFRVFGCQGGTNVLPDAIERAVQAGAQVINMSIGSPLGNPGSIDAVASNNAALAGVTVVASAGNEGPSAYATGAPAVATRVISVAAMDAQASFPGATIHLATQGNVAAINANNGALPASGTLNVFHDNPATPCNADTGEGCEESGTRHDSYVFNAFTAGQIAVTFRGNGARVDRAKQGQTEGAAAVVMVNNVAGFPPFENVIAGATIPFLGVSNGDAAKFATDDGTAASAASAGAIPNPDFKHTADFTSGGPRREDLMIKPDVAAPGVSVFSADGGSTSQGKNLSGTSMASPATAGVAALVKQAHPTWFAREIKAAIVGTAAPGKLVPYDTRLAGSGLATPRKAVDTQSIIFTDPGSSSLTFSYHQLSSGPGTTAYQQTRAFTINNKGATALTYNLSNGFNTTSKGLVVKISPTSITVPAHSSRAVNVTLSMSEAAAAALPDVAPGHGPDLASDDFGQLFAPLLYVAGAVTAAPTTSGPGVYALRVPWLVGPRAVSSVQALQSTRTPYVKSGTLRASSIQVKNFGLHNGIADVYQWGLQDANDGLDGIDLRAAGVQSVDPSVCDSAAPASARCLIFAINTWGRWSNAAENLFEIDIDLNHDGIADFAVVGVDAGAVLGALTGVELSVIIDLSTGSIANLYFAAAPTDGSTLLLPVLTSDIGLSASGDQNFEYAAASQDFYDFDVVQSDEMGTGSDPALGSPVALYNAFRPQLSNGQFMPLNPGAKFTLPLTVHIDQFRTGRGELGWLIVTDEDANGAAQADTVPVGRVVK
jgi:minor extracellular serine protease Vpr